MRSHGYLALVTCLAAAPVSAQSFAEPISLIKAERLSEAEKLLKRIQPAACHAKRDYLLSVIYRRRGHVTEAGNAAISALDCNPTLVEPYRSAAKGLLKWAALETRKTRISLEMSEENSTVHDLALLAAEAQAQSTFENGIERWLPDIGVDLGFLDMIATTASTPSQLDCLPGYGSEDPISPCPAVVPEPDTLLPEGDW